MKKIILFLCALIAPVMLTAQYYDENAAGPDVVASGPHYLAGILAGLFIAIGLQLLLTNLSIASGISVFGPLDKKYKASKRRGRGVTIKTSPEEYNEGLDIKGRTPNVYDIYTSQPLSNDPYSNIPPIPYDPTMAPSVPNENVTGAPYTPGSHDRPGVKVRTSIDRKYTESSMDKAHDTVRTIAAGFGLWSLITASIALFFASWLAVELSLTVSSIVGAIIGLTIWSLFFVTVTILEYTAFSSLAGSLINTAMFGLRSVKETLKSVFSKSDASKSADIAQEITKSVINEFQSDVNVRQLKKQLQNWVNEFKPQKYELRDIRKEIEKILDHTDIDIVTKSEGPIISADEVQAHFRSGGRTITANAKNVADSINNAFHQIKEERGHGKTKSSSMASAGMNMVGLSHENIENVKQKLGEYLKMTENQQLDPDAIKDDIEKLFSDPKGGYQALKARVSSIDKETIVKFVTNVDGLTEDQARNYVNKVESAINKIVGRTGTGPESKSTQGHTGEFRTGESFGEGFNEYAEEHAPDSEGLKSKVLSWLDTHTPGSINVEDWLHDFGMIFSDPKEGFDNVLARLKSVDRQTVTELVSLNSNLSPEEANQMVDKIENYRDEMIHKYESLKEETYHRIQQAKNEALHQAEEVRKTAATAAWWAFGMALISGVAAVVGGIIGSGV